METITSIAKIPGVGANAMTSKNPRGMNYDDLVRITVAAAATALKEAGCEVSVSAVVFHAAEILFREVQDPHIYAERETELIPIVEKYLAEECELLRV